MVTCEPLVAIYQYFACAYTLHTEEYWQAVERVVCKIPLTGFDWWEMGQVKPGYGTAMHGPKFNLHFFPHIAPIPQLQNDRIDLHCLE